MRARAAVLRLSYGVLLGWIWTLPEASAVFDCRCKNLDICQQQCNSTKEFSAFYCFGRRTTQILDYRCTWSLRKQYSSYNLHIFTQHSGRKPCNQRQLENQSMKTKPFVIESANMTAYAFAVSEDQKNCIFAKFTGSLLKMIHCGPPDKSNVIFTRRHGNLSVTAEWHDNSVKHFYLKYREQNSTLWKEVKSQNSKDCILGNLNSSLSYEIQIQCVVTTDCPQCPLSEVISIPQEFVDTPTITKIILEPFQTGQRKVIVVWQYVHSEAVEGYNITVWKPSGELAGVSSYILRSPTITLILCYSAYNINISAFNRAGASPPAYGVVEVQEDLHAWHGQFNVDVKSPESFNLSWYKNVSLKYACYSVEWWATGEKTSYKSFFKKKEQHDVTTQNGTFKPYKKYHFFLHARPDKDTCNLKNMNNSEWTYGRAQAYLLEGTPHAAPGNLSISNITQSSCVLTWLPVAEEDLRGFLRGYIIYYVDTLDTSEKNITVDPHVNSYELKNLQSRRMYHVQLSAYTAAGEGRRSDFMTLKTNPDAVAIGGMLAAVIVGIVVLLLAVHLCCRLLQRSKNLLWPSIPNPCNSNAVQKIEGGHELMMEPLYKQNLEETEEHVTVVEVKKDACCSRALISQDYVEDTLIPVAAAAEDNGTSLTNSISADAFSIDSEEKDSAPVPPVDTDSTENRDNSMADSSNAIATDCVSTAAAKPAMVFVSDYTTMELFQQIAKAGLQDPSSQAGSSETAPSNPGQDYIRQALTYAEDMQHERCFR
ncbi:interleukin-6 receptor subunit beta isoform X2 [Salminus brasiliensis]|uniref:interleukin-6 receptor subunit beta isoform X2 n=1 Tax=Salminus brasiliensis TaxID=930266 RepID=UPI003B8368D2